MIFLGPDTSESAPATVLGAPTWTFDVLLAALAETPAAEVALALSQCRRNLARRTFDLPGGLKLGPGCSVMGILNVTPDSFSDGGRLATVQDAVDAALRMAEAGAAVVDVGGESTRPGAAPVAEEEELRRAIPVVEALARRGLYVSIDTSKARVAEAACAAGAKMVNDITGLGGDPRMGETVARAGAALVVMHMQGTPRTMQENPRYNDVVGEVMAALRGAVAKAVAAGVAEEAIVVDPGIGFGKRVAHNVELMARLGEFRCLGRPVLVGPSRKRFLGELTGRPVEARDIATAAAVTAAALAGAALVRVHDVPAAVDAVKVANALAAATGPAATP